MEKNVKVTVYGQGKEQVQERPEKTLSLHLSLILGTETAYNNNNNNNNNNNKENRNKAANSEECGEFDFQLHY